MNKMMNFAKLVKLHAESGSRLSQIEKEELSGCLLNRDMCLERTDVLHNVIESDSYKLWDYISAFLFNDNDETREDVLTEIKRLFTQYYDEEMDELIATEEENIKEELARQNPNDEYVPE